MSDHLTDMWRREFVMNPDMRYAADAALHGAYAGTDYPRPTVDEVITHVLAVVAEDTLERSRDNAECAKVDECAASAIVLRYLARWLTPQPTTDGGPA